MVDVTTTARDFLKNQREKKTGHDTLFTVILLHNIKMDREREERLGGGIKWKEILAVVISLLKMIWKDLTAKSAISPKML